MKAIKLCSLLLLGLVVVLTGCSANKKLIAQKDQEIARLQEEVSKLKGEVDEEKAQREQLKRDLEKALAEYRGKEQLWVEEKDKLTKVVIPEAVTFAFSSTRLTPKGKEILDKIWGVLAKYPKRRIYIEGHTDNVPIAPEFRDRFRSNWEFSSARAHSVLHYILSKYKADPKRFAVVGYGEYQPVADNSTPEGRAKNRRVVIAVRDEF